MKPILAVLVATTLLSACATANLAPVTGADNKKVVYIRQMKMSYAKSKSVEKTNIGIQLLVLVATGGIVSPPIGSRADFLPNEIQVTWDNKEEFPAFLPGGKMEIIPYSPYLEENLRAGEWAYYNPNATDRSQLFTPCPTHCGPAGTPTLSGRLRRAQYLVWRENDRASRVYIKNKATATPQETQDYYAQRDRRNAELVKELDRIAAEYKRNHK